MIIFLAWFIHLKFWCSVAAVCWDWLSCTPPVSLPPLPHATPCTTVAFRIYDMDKDGYISNGELFQVLKMMVGNNLKDTQLQQIVDKTIINADKDGDGRISFEEFCAVSPSPSGALLGSEILHRFLNWLDRTGFQFHTSSWNTASRAVNISCCVPAAYDGALKILSQHFACYATGVLDRATNKRFILHGGHMAVKWYM